MRRTSISIAVTLAIAGSLGGCAVHSIHSGGDKSYPARNEVPIASNFSTSTQLKLQAAEHWRRVASDTAGALVKPFPKGTSLYLRRSCETTGCAPRACDTTFKAVEIGPGTWALRDHVSLIDKVGNAAVRTDGHDANWYRAEFAAGATPRNELVITVSAMAGDKT